VFTLLERFLPRTAIQEIKESTTPKWDPRDLPPAHNRQDEIDRGDTIASLCFTLLALVAANYFANRLGDYELGQSGWRVAQVIHLEHLTVILPFLSAIWLLEILQQVTLLVQRRWTIANRMFAIALSLASAGLLAM